MSAINLPDHSRVWVYQANRFLTDEEVQSINEKATQFVAGWAAHGASLHANASCIHNLFLVLMVDEEQAMASGCSIDSSVHFVQGLEQEFQVEFMDRMRAAWVKGDQVIQTDMEELKAQYIGGIITNETVVFDNLVNTKKDFDLSWRKPLAESWHYRFLN